MKQLTDSSWHKGLSELATLKWRTWCIENNYGSVFEEDEFIEILQPSLGQLLEFLKGHLMTAEIGLLLIRDIKKDKESGGYIDFYDPDEWLDICAKKATEILERPE